jgi:TonB family protein
MKATTVLSGVPGRYGAEELKSGYRRFLLRALILSSFIHFVFWGTWWIKSGLYDDGHPKPRPKTLRPVFNGAVYVPPSVLSPSVDFPVVRIGVGGTDLKAERGIPVPVPGFPTEKWNLDPLPVNAAGGGEAGIPGGAEGGGAIGMLIEEAPPDIFVLFEQEPMVVTNVDPAYPEICRQAGLTGTVTARLWITKEGKVRDVVIAKSDSELFNEAVVDAAKQWVFTPALTKKGPVAVWWAVVFHLKLK